MEQTYGFNHEGLTKKNRQYIVDVERHLRTAAVLPADQIKTLVDEMATEVQTAQKQNVTARQHYGKTPQQFAAEQNEVITKPKPKEASWWLRGVDGGLLVMGIMLLAVAATAFIGKSNESVTSIPISLILMSFVIGGAGMAGMQYYTLKIRDQGKKGLLKYALYAVVFVIVWMLLAFVFTAILPVNWNIVLQPPMAIILGVLVLVLKWYLKRKYNITPITRF
ncbi:DUF1129 domain-containing protein [Brochothrix campestris]|uniref:DUF1129 domain-containing protein n=1 Tax=Brochothrix campestris TaxID=2757 RepID=UPI0038CF84B8